MAIEVKTPSLLELVAADAEVQRIATDFKFTEGPVWNPAAQCLLFSDMPGDVRRSWSEADGIVEVRKPANKCNGMTYDSRGNLIVCEHSTSLVVSEAPDGTITTVASHYQGKALNSPNDVIAKSDDAIYFSDPTYGRMPVFGLEREQELDFQGVFRVAPGGGEPQLLVDDFGQPNGLCFSPDESVLYINDTPGALIRVFDVKPDGTLDNDRLFLGDIGTGELEGGAPDGMKCDERGNVYVTGPRGIWVISPAGEHLGIIEMPEHAGNLNWGGADWKELYCCCSTSVYRVRLKVAGNRLSYMR